jgi:hypothetical protein
MRVGRGRFLDEVHKFRDYTKERTDSSQPQKLNSKNVDQGTPKNVRRDQLFSYIVISEASFNPMNKYLQGGSWYP